MERVEYLLKDRHLIPGLSAKLRSFVKLFHCHIEVAKKYLAS